MITKTCSVSGKEFIITDEDLVFYEKMGVPEPKLCPEERKRRRMSWATFRTLHHRKCDATDKPILSMYAADCKHPVYHSDYWWTDSWDPLEHGQDFDFSRPFFEQFDEVFSKVPAMHQSVLNVENCEYVNMSADCKDCYLSFYIDFCEDCYYVQHANKNRTCVDCLGIFNSELCYECVDCEHGYELLYSIRSRNCSTSYFLTDCRNCRNCIGCYNLVNKEYYIFNEKVTPEKFLEVKNSLQNVSKVSEMRDYLKKFCLKFPKKHYFGHTCENCTGDDIHNAKNVFESFCVHDAEDVKYCDYVFGVHNTLDLTIFGHNSEWIYNCLKTGDQCSDNICCLCCWTGCSNNAYCHLVLNTKNCFGCSGLRQKEYCILNKQYEKEEYERLRDRIVEHMKETGEWGEFFPVENSPFAYNETMAQDFLPLDKTVVLGRGYRWRDEVVKSTYQGESYEFSENIEVVEDDVLHLILTCEISGKNYRITKPELEFYRKLNLPIPRIYPDERHKERMQLRNPRELWDRECDTCDCSIQTTYSPDRKEKVLCEECYNKVVN